MRLFLYISDFIVPFMILSILIYGIFAGVNVYDTFIKGAKRGFWTVVRLMPTLIGLMAAVGILRKMPLFPSQSRLQKARRRRQANGKTLPISPISKPSRIPMPPWRSCGRNTRRPSPAPKSKAFPLPPEPIACPRMSLPFWLSLIHI